MLITSLHYFSGLVEEASEVGDTYWLHVRCKADHMKKGGGSTTGAKALRKDRANDGNEIIPLTPQQ